MLKVDNINKKILVSIPLTANSGKIRVKKRSMVNEYGIPFATKQISFGLDSYIEWQISYDVWVKDSKKIKETTLPNSAFTGANGKDKALYELSEYIYYFYNWNIIDKESLLGIVEYLNDIDGDELLDKNKEIQITRSHAIEKNINGFNFEYTQVNYPLLIHKFGEYEIISEIKITEKQRAIGIQPMLYFCFPIVKLLTKEPLIGRAANSKEFGYFEISKDNIFVFVELLKMFGILSEPHRIDIIRIIESIVK
ncbi:MAG: R.Pab1 family restriction endonuclease [bacterium]|nr:R.Pab1 family restriction endonuclease [bacterium]